MEGEYKFSDVQVVGFDEPVWGERQAFLYAPVVRDVLPPMHMEPMGALADSYLEVIADEREHDIQSVIKEIQAHGLDPTKIDTDMLNIHPNVLANAIAVSVKAEQKAPAASQVPLNKKPANPFGDPSGASLKNSPRSNGPKDNKPQESGQTPA